MQYTYAEYFGYLNLARNILVCIADIKARIAALVTGTTHIQVDVGKTYSYLDGLATHTVAPILILPSDLRQILLNL